MPETPRVSGATPGHQRGNLNATAGTRRASGEKNLIPGNTELTHGPPVHGETLNGFFNWVNGVTSKPGKHNYFCLRDITKAMWVIYPVLQLVGLVNERVEKLARAWYGVCWSIVYSCYRPWKDGRDMLTEKNAPDPSKVTPFWKTIYKLNEHMRVFGGTLVSGIYGFGAFKMLYKWLKGDDQGFDDAAKIYKTGMYNQNVIFACMNADIVMRRFLNPTQLKPVDKPITGFKAMTEYIDTALYIPNIIARGIATCELFGLKIGDGLNRFIRGLACFSYGTWAARFGIMKSSPKIDERGEIYGGDLENSNPLLHKIQKGGGQVFYTLLPALSWIAAGAEFLGLKDFAEKVMDLEGKCERLLPAIPAWCLASPWLEGLGLIKPVPKSKLSSVEV